MTKLAKIILVSAAILGSATVAHAGSTGCKLDCSVLGKILKDQSLHGN